MESDKPQPGDIVAQRYAVFDRLPKAELIRLRKQAKSVAESIAKALRYNASTSDHSLQGSSALT
jgi:hypothetical protein